MLVCSLTQTKIWWKKKNYQCEKTKDDKDRKKTVCRIRIEKLQTQSLSLKIERHNFNRKCDNLFIELVTEREWKEKFFVLCIPFFLYFSHRSTIPYSLELHTFNKSSVILYVNLHSFNIISNNLFRTNANGICDQRFSERG